MKVYLAKIEIPKEYLVEVEADSEMGAQLGIMRGEFNIVAMAPAECQGKPHACCIHKIEERK